MNEEKSDNCSIEGTSAKALRQEESCRHFRKRNMQMWPKNSEGEEESRRKEGREGGMKGGQWLVIRILKSKVQNKAQNKASWDAAEEQARTLEIYVARY